jgi:hypothetical protein
MEIINLDDISVGETQVSEIPDLHSLLIKNLVFAIVRIHIVFNLFVIDNCWFYGFSIAFNLRFRFQLIADVTLHFY